MAEYLAELGFDVHVICCRDMDKHVERINNVTIWDAAQGLNYSKATTPQKLYLLKNILSQRIEEISQAINPKIIQVSSPLLIPIATRIKEKTSAKLVYDCYEYWTGGALAARKFHSALIYEVIHRVYSNQIDGSIFVYMGNPTAKLFKNPIWITNLPKSCNIPLKPNVELRKSIYSDEDFVIGYLGVITGLKGYKTAINCLKYLEENYKLLVVGKFGNKSIENEIVKHINNQKLESRVHITGYIPSFIETLQYASIMDLGLMIADNTPWQRYTLPAKLIDYISLGIPVIASDIKSYNEFISRYQCGLLVPPKDTKKIAESIRDLYKNDLLRITLGKKGKEAFENSFSEKKQLYKLKTLYKCLIEDSRISKH